LSLGSTYAKKAVCANMFRVLLKIKELNSESKKGAFTWIAAF